MMTDSIILSLTDQIRQEISGEAVSPGHQHARLLQLADELKLAIETPTETVLRLIYQVSYLAPAIFPKLLILNLVLASRECCSAHRCRYGDLPTLDQRRPEEWPYCDGYSSLYWSRQSIDR